MWLTKNEKKVLKLLIDNAKLSDTSIANRLNISSQAVGRIRKKLEEEVIKNYTLELDLSKLGLNSLSLIEVKCPPKDGKESQEKSINCPNVVNVIKLMKGTHTYKVIRICSDLEECEKCNFGNYSSVTISDAQTLPVSNMIKNNFKPLLHKAIDNLGTKTTKIKFGLGK